MFLLVALIAINISEMVIPRITDDLDSRQVNLFPIPLGKILVHLHKCRRGGGMGAAAPQCCAEICLIWEIFEKEQ